MCVGWPIGGGPSSLREEEEERDEVTWEVGKVEGGQWLDVNK